MLKLNPVTVKSFLKPFVSSGALEFKQERKFHMYRAKADDREFKELLAFRNIRLIRESGIIEYLNEELFDPCIILFGSWMKGENIPRSDIDIFILSSDKKKLDLSEFEKKLGNPIHLFLNTKKELSRLKKDSAHLLNNIINGRILSGSLELF